ncbi:MAG: hypothetical protein ACODAE_10990 [Gemmatimonadota bacterium]
MNDGTDGADRIVPLHIELSALVRRSVATLYSHLVTRPTGEAIRLGIERQIAEMASLCVSVLDFDRVVVLDYSCADEMVAKLIQRYRTSEADVYFVARAVGESHREPIEAVLERHGLALVAHLADGTPALLGDVDPLEADAWAALERLAVADGPAVADAAGLERVRVEAALERLCGRRLALRAPDAGAFLSLSALLGTNGAGA